MGSNKVSYSESLKSVVGSFFNEYRDTTASYSAITVATLVFWLSGTAGTSSIRTHLRFLAVAIVLFSLIYTYYVGRPFGISLDWTPTHLSQGDRVPDVMSESRENALIQDSDLLIYAEARFSKFSSGFELQFETSSEIEVELENTPRREHEYDPQQNILKCDEMTERTFPLKLRVYPSSSVDEAGRYHGLSFLDVKSDSKIVEIDIIDVR